MSQRIRRAQDRKNGMTVATGGHVVHHDRGETPVVRTPPMKSTGDVSSKDPGFAKASPFFKKLEEIVKPKSKAEETKVIAEATQKVDTANEKKDQENEAK